MDIAEWGTTVQAPRTLDFNEPAAITGNILRIASVSMRRQHRLQTF